MEQLEAFVEKAKAKFIENKETVIRIGSAIGGAILGAVVTALIVNSQDNEAYEMMSPSIVDEDEDDNEDE